MAPDLEQLLSKTPALLRQREMITEEESDAVIRLSREIVAALMHNAGKLKAPKNPNPK
jgi:hypothetical protein